MLGVIIPGAVCPRAARHADLLLHGQVILRPVEAAAFILRAIYSHQSKNKPNIKIVQTYAKLKWANHIRLLDTYRFPRTKGSVRQEFAILCPFVYYLVREEPERDKREIFSLWPLAIATHTSVSCAKNK